MTSEEEGSFVRAAQGEVSEPLAGAEHHALPQPHEPEPEAVLAATVAEELAIADEQEPVALQPTMDVPPEALPEDVPIGAELTVEELAEPEPSFEPSAGLDQQVEVGPGA